MLTNEHIHALSVITDAARQVPSLVWGLTGSTSFALQGMALEVHDIDVQTDAASAYELEALLRTYVVEPVRFCGTDKIQSHFGKLHVVGMAVEIMGAVQKRLPDGSWEKKQTAAALVGRCAAGGDGTPRSFYRLRGAGVPAHWTHGTRRRG